MNLPVQDTIERICGFLSDIGIAVRFRPIERATFLPGIMIENGTLVVDRDRLLYPGDLLHEAGHIALETPERRPTLQDDVEAGKSPGQSVEMAVILWSYAALRHLDLAPEIVFHEHGYKGSAQWLLDEFAAGRYLALPLLQWMGMTFDESTAAKAGAVPFPAMRCWLRPT